MTLKECYAKIGGNYEDASARLMTDNIVAKFAIKFLDDTSYDTLIKSLDSGDYDEAFRAAHTIKGICQNLSFTALFNSVNPLTEELRVGAPSSQDLITKVTEDYERTISAIKEFQSAI